MRHDDPDRPFLLGELVEMYIVAAIIAAVWIVAYFSSMYEVRRWQPLTFDVPMWDVSAVAAILLLLGSIGGLVAQWRYHVRCKTDPNPKRKGPPDPLWLGFLRKKFFK